MARNALRRMVALGGVVAMAGAVVALSSASAMPRVERVIVLAICEIGVASANAKIARPMPASMVVGMLSSVSMSQRTFSWSMIRCSTQGIRTTFSTTVRAAEKYRCG